MAYSHCTGLGPGPVELWYGNGGGVFFVRYWPFPTILTGNYSKPHVTVSYTSLHITMTSLPPKALQIALCHHNSVMTHI